MEVNDELDLMIFNEFDDELTNEHFSFPSLTLNEVSPQTMSSSNHNMMNDFNMKQGDFISGVMNDLNATNFATVFDMKSEPIVPKPCIPDKRQTRGLKSAKDVKAIPQNHVTSSRKRSLPLDNSVVNGKVMNIPTYSKDDMKVSDPIMKSAKNTMQMSGISPEVSAVISSLSAKDEELLNSLLGNSKLLSSDDDGDDFGDDEDMDNELGFSTGAPGVDGSDRKKKRGRKVSSNPDTAIIAAAIDAHLKKLNIDPTSKEGKKQRRRLRNRMSAQLHRERKKAYIDELEAKVREKDMTIDRMNQEMETLRKDNAMLRKRLGLSTVSSSLTSSPMNLSIKSRAMTDGSTSDEDSDSVALSDDASSSNMSIKSGGSYRLLSVILLFCWAIYGIRPDIALESSSSADGSIPTLTFTLPRLPAPKGSLHNIWENLKHFHENSEAIADSIRTTHRVLTSKQDADENVEELKDDVHAMDMDMDEDVIPPLSILPPVLTLPPLPSAQASASRPIVTSSHAMWKYQSHVLQLFPQLQIDDGTGSRSMGYDEPRSRHRYNEDTTRKYLRVRRDVNGSSSFKSIPSSSSHDSLVYVPLSSHDTSSESNQPSNAISRVLVTEGKTLLDPSLACKSSPIIQPITTQPSDQGPINSGSVINRIFSSSSLDTPRTVYSVRMDSSSSSSSSNAPHSTAVALTADSSSHISGDQSNLLVMLLPASSVRWGKSWSDSSDNSMDWMLRSLNYTSNSTSDQHSYHDESFETGSKNPDSSLDDLWIEIGCSIFRAQVVRNVTLNK